MISPNILDQQPFVEDDTKDNTVNNTNQNNQINQQQNVNYNNNMINNNQINNNNDQIRYHHSDNNINRINYNNFNVANSHIPFNYNYNISNTHVNPNLNNFGEMGQNQYISSPMINQNNNGFRQGNNMNHQINQTQVNPPNYPGDIEIHRRAATTEESCHFQ